jgi:hypothetical protein
MAKPKERGGMARHVAELRVGRARCTLTGITNDILECVKPIWGEYNGRRRTFASRLRSSVGLETDAPV